MTSPSDTDKELEFYDDYLRCLEGKITKEEFWKKTRDSNHDEVISSLKTVILPVQVPRDEYLNVIKYLDAIGYFKS